jgi:hypothetical protein
LVDQEVELDSEAGKAEGWEGWEDLLAVEALPEEAEVDTEEGVEGTVPVWEAESEAEVDLLASEAKEEGCKVELVCSQSLPISVAYTHLHSLETGWCLPNH